MSRKLIYDIACNEIMEILDTIDSNYFPHCEMFEGIRDIEYNDEVYKMTITFDKKEE